MKDDDFCLCCRLCVHGEACVGLFTVGLPQGMKVALSVYEKEMEDRV